MFVNMDSSARAAEDIRGLNVCLGIDINYVCGKPVSRPEDIPHLVNEEGSFISSGIMAAKSRKLGTDELEFISYFEEDPYPYDEVRRETENQVKKFIELNGRKPEYMHPHSLMSENCYRAAKDVTKEYDILHTMDVMRRYPLLPGTFDGMTTANQMDFDVTGNLIHRGLPSIKEGETRCFICHCGYVDYELFSRTTLTLRRVKDLYAMRSEELMEYLEKHKIERITYRDLQEI